MKIALPGTGLATTVPARDALPLTLANGAVLGPTARHRSSRTTVKRLPAIVIVLPGIPHAGAKVPPLLTASWPTVPVPVSAAPELTMSAHELAIEPVTFSVPPLTSVMPR